tara:strand:+ start:71 stop:1285 length:1215 start_codon:yes stop_codon:yes gene_type:complete
MKKKPKKNIYKKKVHKKKVHKKKVHKQQKKQKKNKKNASFKRRKKNKLAKVKSKFIFKKAKLPFDRLKKIKLPKFKLKKIKIPKFKKKQIFKIKKRIGEASKLSFQRLLNFVLTPVFKAYDNYSENKKIKKIKELDFEQKDRERKIKEEKELIFQQKQREIKQEEKFARVREQDLKKFIRQEQAILRREQAEKRQQFLEEIKLDKKIKAFRKRELEEIKNLEKLALQEQREDYRGVEQRLEKIKEKYRLIREQKIRERVKALGVEISDTDTKEDILEKEKEYESQRQKIELVLESFYRSAASLVFQLNKRYIPKHKSILRCINRIYESNECFIKYDDSIDEDWLILIYLEDSDTKKGKIIVENKANPEKHETKSFEIKEIFTYSDYLVDTMTAHIDRERKKKPY